ncbi:MAG: integration host factor subunit alpha [Desulfobacterales bacterium]
MTLTKNEIVEQVSELGFSKRDSFEIIENLLEIIKRSLETGEDVLVSGFGKFQVKDKASRRGRNPATAQEMILDARRVVTFKSSGKLRARINNQNRHTPE